METTDWVHVKKKTEEEPLLCRYKYPKWPILCTDFSILDLRYNWLGQHALNYPKTSLCFTEKKSTAPNDILKI